MKNLVPKTYFTKYILNILSKSWSTIVIDLSAFLVGYFSSNLKS